ncbi:FRG domain-containing protein [Pandoraea terrae]|uniref:FRG domain-containing protein n=1 Tax=Pandoraea terrae TaxID=1537710 RepID=A0A5E4ZA83_9BURK|nr:FRG domain-containing protein [Pandoraea terrae]VVE58251.1 FRG domain-containing protein [Pandoraea terrae]
MRGQWIGGFQASGWHGSITIDAESVGEKIGGSVSMFPGEGSEGTITVGRIVPFEPQPGPVDITVLANPIHPGTGLTVPWEELERVFPNMQFGRIIQAKVEWDQQKLTATWHSNIGASGKATLLTTDAGRPSELTPIVMDWETFKRHVAQVEPRRYVFRGQRKPWRLRSAFHRTGRCDLVRYTGEDMQALHRHLSAHTKHVFNRGISEENGAMLHLAQHHGFPTPLIDWSHSPFVAAYFAYHKIKNSEAANSDAEDRIRIHQFDRQQWMDDHRQISVTAPAAPHFSLLEFLPIENQRLIPQQAISGLTNVVDVEHYIAWAEGLAKKQYLTAIELPVASRETVMRELTLMGVTAGSLFPGLDGTCAELIERLFPS